MNPIKIFSGWANEPLAAEICKHLSLPLGKVKHHQFPSGEYHSVYSENVRGCDLYLIQPGTRMFGEHAGSANDALMQLLVMVDCARRASANKITVVIPYMAYSRQDKKDASRSPITMKMIMNLIAEAGATRIIAMDLHAAQIQGFTDLPFDHLYFSTTFLSKLRNGLAFGGDNCVVVAPDVGASKRAEAYAEALDTELVVIPKSRKGDTKVTHGAFSGNVEDKRVLMVDDLTESAGTLIGAAKLCRENGAKEVLAAVTHGCLTEVGVDRLGKAMTDKVFDFFFHSDTVTYNWHLKSKPDNIETLSVAPVFARAIRCTHENKSISELFEIKA